MIALRNGFQVLEMWMESCYLAQLSAQGGGQSQFGVSKQYLCVDLCVNLCVDSFLDMQIAMSVDMCADMFVDMGQKCM